MAGSSPSHSSADRSLSEWLAWQESLHPAEIDLGLERVRAVRDRLRLEPPPDRVFTVAGTNGKGSTVAVLERILRANGQRTGVYTSPHLVRYNERIAVAGEPASDAAIISAFEQIEAARGDIPLTYFEFGTLAALLHFAAADCDAWVLEVGLGGRLDAVNIIDADVAVITTVDLDHQAWLGDSIEEIAAEKAGIVRRGKPAFFGDLPVPENVVSHAGKTGAVLHWQGHGYSYQADAQSGTWCWQGLEHSLLALTIPSGGDAQLRNQAVALAAIEACDPKLLDVLSVSPALLAGQVIPGRMQRHVDKHRWILDVAHNPQAARVLRDALGDERPAAVVIGMLADKSAESFAAAVGVSGACWLTCPTEGNRGASAATLARELGPFVDGRIIACDTVEAALEQARCVTPEGELILVCGSFGVVGPALQWLGLY